VAFDQSGHDSLQRNAMQGIAGMGDGRNVDHAGAYPAATPKVISAKRETQCPLESDPTQGLSAYGHTTYAGADGEKHRRRAATTASSTTAEQRVSATEWLERIARRPQTMGHHMIPPPIRIPSRQDCQSIEIRHHARPCDQPPVTL
jgi:hypothetical protein